MELTYAERRYLANAQQYAGLAVTGTSYHSSVPSGQKGLMEELQKQLFINTVASVGNVDKDILNTFIRQELAGIERRRSEAKAQAEATRSTAITAAVTVLTLGAGGFLGPAIQNGLSALGSATASLLGPLANLASTGLPLLQSTANVGAAVIRGAIQAIDGSRNGPEGIVAGLVNGVFGVMTAGGGMDLTRFATAAPLLQNTALGVGVSYDRDNGWGGMLGIGNATQNLSLRLSEYGGARLEGSASIVNGIQINGNYNAATGGFGIGANINAGDGPRSGANLNINYDTIERFSGGISYTDSTTGFGMSYRVDREGNVTISSLLNGVVMGTVTGNGYSNMDMDWVQHNINAAQDRGRLLGQIALLKEDGLSEDQIKNLDEEGLKKAVAKAELNNRLRTVMSEEKLQGLTETQKAALWNVLGPQPTVTQDLISGAMGALGITSLLGFLGLTRRKEGETQTTVGSIASGALVGGFSGLMNLFTNTYEAFNPKTEIDLLSVADRNSLRTNGYYIMTDGTIKVVSLSSEGKLELSTATEEQIEMIYAGNLPVPDQRPSLLGAGLGFLGIGESQTTVGSILSGALSGFGNNILNMFQSIPNTFSNGMNGLSNLFSSSYNSVFSPEDNNVRLSGEILKPEEKQSLEAKGYYISSDGKIMVRSSTLEGDIIISEATLGQQELIRLGIRPTEVFNQQPNIIAAMIGKKPIHENLTEESARLAGFDLANRPGIGQGNYDADFPVNSYFTSLVILTNNLSPSLALALFGNTETYRVHLGDRQHTHTMQSSPDETVEQTRTRVLEEAKALYTLAIDPDIQLSQYDRDRLVGRLIHMVQDSYSKGHTLREGKDQNDGGIVTFFNYLDPANHATHNKYDNVKDHERATEVVTDILKIYDSPIDNSWETMSPILENIFRLNITPPPNNPNTESGAIRA
ncbi:hypothetical protein [Leptospira idonii]|uniref:TIGR04388 family protein n=1 Tax=Leptospira idonii TaxID=1193500 RepID=A0A4R9M0R7_9LEPT|nr:hypothetical protein [Leptospira idonii]TGN20270.1 hypothetical protein EHS15_04610 [Leptospira idonii]